MIRAASDDPAGVDELVAAIAPGLAGLGLPVINRREVVLVTGPWLAGVSGVRAALAERLPQRRFVETAELGPGDAPVAVVFVVSAATALTESDCVLLDTAAEHTDAVVAVVSKIDVHRGWRDVLTSNRDRLAARASRYARVPWVGAAAAPELGEPYLDDLVAAIQKQLADPAVARRNMLRAWESRLLMVARRFDGDAQSAGRRARVDALRQQRRTVLRQGRQSKSEHTIALRAQIQHARVKLSYFARNRCSLLRVELQEHVAGLSRKDIARFAAYTRGQVQEVVAEVGEGAVAHLADVAQLLGVPVQPPVLENLPAVLPTVVAPPLTSRRLEIRLTTLLGAGFGLGIALTLSRLVAGLTPGLAASGMVAGVAIGLAVTAWVVNARALLHDRVVVDRWTGEVTASLRSVVEQLVATRVVAVETLLSTAISERDDAENARVADQVSIIDGELREHAVAAARAAALRDREMPAVRAAFEAVRAELGEPGTPTTGLF